MWRMAVVHFGYSDTVFSQFFTTQWSKRAADDASSYHLLKNDILQGRMNHRDDCGSCTTLSSARNLGKQNCALTTALCTLQALGTSIKISLELLEMICYFPHLKVTELYFRLSWNLLIFVQN